jgi:hypothetical protein
MTSVNSRRQRNGVILDTRSTRYRRVSGIDDGVRRRAQEFAPTNHTRAFERIRFRRRLHEGDSRISALFSFRAVQTERDERRRFHKVQSTLLDIDGNAHSFNRQVLIALSRSVMIRVNVFTDLIANGILNGEFCHDVDARMGNDDDVRNALRDI